MRSVEAAWADACCLKWKVGSVPGRLAPGGNVERRTAIELEGTGGGGTHGAKSEVSLAD